MSAPLHSIRSAARSLFVHPSSLSRAQRPAERCLAAVQAPCTWSTWPRTALTRLYIVVSKAVAEDTLEYLFGVFEGLEYVDLKRDHVSGLSRVRTSALWDSGCRAQGLRA